MKKRLRFVSLLLLSLNHMTGFAETHIVTLPNGQLEEVYVEKQDGYLITEGDILIEKDAQKYPDAVVVEKVGGKRWARNIIPFVIQKNLPTEGRENIYRAMLEIALNSKVRFKERSLTSPEKNYIAFVPSGSTVCASHVGRKGGRQEIVLAPRCKKGSTMHEILHALGIWHEQSRADRDSYIKVMWKNITEEKKYNFSKHIRDGIDVGEYDYDSIMHYGARSFSKNGEDTIIPLQEGKKIGQRDKLSQKDIKAIAYLFPN